MFILDILIGLSFLLILMGIAYLGIGAIKIIASLMNLPIVHIVVAVILIIFAFSQIMSMGKSIRRLMTTLIKNAKGDKEI